MRHFSDFFQEKKKKKTLLKTQKHEERMPY